MASVLAVSVGMFKTAGNLLFLPLLMQSTCFSLLIYGIYECQLCVSSGWRVGNGKEKDLKTNTKFFKAYNAIKAIFDKKKTIQERTQCFSNCVLSNLSKNTLLMFLLFLLMTQILFDNLILHFTLCSVLAV